MALRLIGSLRDELSKLTDQKDPEEHSLSIFKTSDKTNASLWLDRMLHAQIITGKSPKNEHPHTTHIKAACSIPENDDYKTFFVNRWLPSFPQENLRIAQATGRLVVGLGSESAWENSITLHRTYGVPYIPGSALKGLAAAYAHQYLQDGVWNKAYTKQDEQGNKISIPIGWAHKVMFGDTSSEGYVTFFDALYLPGSGHNGKALWPDVITVHHPNYYQKTGAEQTPPADWDDPTPIPFVSATGEYLIALAGDPNWVTTAFDILEKALSELGVGAKTSSGYGRIDYLSLEEQEKRLKQFDKPKEIRLPRKGDMVTGQCDKKAIRIEVDGERIFVKRIDPNLNKLDFQLPKGIHIEFYSIDEKASGGFAGVIQAVDDDDPDKFRVFLKRAKKQDRSS